MKIAVPYDAGTVFQHFGHTEYFKIYTIENGQILSSEVVTTNGEGHNALSSFLKRNAVSTLICGGIGGGAVAALKDAGIELYPGISGDADVAVQAFLEGTLPHAVNFACPSHHNEHTHCESPCSHNCHKQE